MQQYQVYLSRVAIKVEIFKGENAFPSDIGTVMVPGEVLTSDERLWDFLDEQEFVREWQDELHTIKVFLRKAHTEPDSDSSEWAEWARRTLIASISLDDG